MQRHQLKVYLSFNAMTIPPDDINYVKAIPKIELAMRFTRIYGTIETKDSSTEHIIELGIHKNRVPIFISTNVGAGGA